MTSKHFFSKKASHRLVIFCTFLLLIALVAVFVSFFIPHTAAQTASTTNSYAIDAAGYKTETLYIGTSTLSVEISDTDTLRGQGLSDRTSLGADQGMLFVFQSDTQPEFWMKDMHFPLDLIWLDDIGEVVDVTNDFLPSSYPETVAPKSPVRYVIEVNAGFIMSHDIHLGEVVKIS